jgi:hypothetical protein
VATAVTAGMAVLLAATSCSLLPREPGPPTIENAPLPAFTGWTDQCVIGTWRLTRGHTVAEGASGEVPMATTGDRTLILAADGTLTIEYPGDGLRWHGSNGTDTIDATVTGVATGTYRVSMGRYVTRSDSSMVFTTVIYNGVVDGPQAGFSANQADDAVFCSGDELVISSKTNRSIYARR